MLEFCKAQQDDSFCGAIALYSIYHLPRVHHLELLVQLKRILLEGSPCLFNVPEHAGEYLQENWLGSEKMYWSKSSLSLSFILLTCVTGHFSVEWYELTLKQLGFELLCKYKEIKEFLGEREVMWYLLFKVPAKEQDDLLWKSK